MFLGLATMLASAAAQHAVLAAISRAAAVALLGFELDASQGQYRSHSVISQVPGLGF